MKRLLNIKTLLIMFLGVGVISIYLFSMPPKQKAVSKEDNGVCSRQAPYTNRPEFQRAYDLVIQRLYESDEGGKYFATTFYMMKNCVHISYANTSKELEGAEGVFYFTSSSTKDDLRILVSPEYKANSDIVTAVLLSHELTHALDYTTDYEISKDAKTRCFDTEINAHGVEVGFIQALNKGELESLSKNFAFDTVISKELTSKESQFMYNTMSILTKAKKENGDILKAVSEYVLGSPFYQKQCSNL